MTQNSQKFTLDKKQVFNLVLENRYKVDPKTRFLSRCIDGRYKNKLKVNPPAGGQKSKVVEEKDLPALAIPGADVGELALIFATANNFGFDVDYEKVYQSLVKVIGGEENFQYHTDHHGAVGVPASGCGHFKQIKLDLKAYDLTTQDLEFLEKKLMEIKKNNQAQEVVLEGDHIEGAILQVKGNWGIYPRYFLETDEGRREVEVFVFHQSLVNERHRLLVKELVKNKAVIFRNGEDEEWLYEVLSDMMDNHLFETVKRLAPDLPIYNVEFKDDGNFKVAD